MRRLQSLFLLLTIRFQWMASTTPMLVAAFSPSIRLAAAASRRPDCTYAKIGSQQQSSFEQPCTSTTPGQSAWSQAPPSISTSLQATTNGNYAHEQETASTATTPQRPYKHVMAILSMPYTSIDRIANEAILETAISKTDKLSVVLRCEGAKKPPSLVSLRRYVGEIYSQLWDLVIDQFPHRGVPDVVVYPQNLPNTAPESWIDIQKDLDCVCTHDSLCGWVSEEATGRGLQYQNRGGRGGLKEHVDALNKERNRRKLEPVVALFPERWPSGAKLETAQDDRVIFLDDEPGTKSAIQQAAQPETDFEEASNGDSSSFLSGAPISSKVLFESVAVGGTFDGLHFGHRKLLTLALSSVQPMTGRLLVGITVDEMLRQKKHAQDISPFEQRSETIRHFIHRLAPGMLNRIKLVPITDKFGPPGQPDLFFDALVLSHEVLDTGYELNQHRASLGLDPLYLLCTRRTEAQVMSSTTMRKAKAQQASSKE